MDWCIEKNETVEQEIIGRDGEKCYGRRGISTSITVDTIEDAKQKAEEWGLNGDESIGTWSGKEDNLWATILTSNPKIKTSVLHLFINPEIIIQHSWKKGVIIRDDTGKEITNQMILGDMTTGKEIKRCIEIRNGIVIRKPRDVEILGEKTPKGFALRGITLKNKYTGPELSNVYIKSHDQ